MRVSYVIVTHNRRDSLLRTLEILHRTTPLPSHEWEAWVVDNASKDHTIESVQARFPDVRVIACRSNEGVGARSRAFAQAAGEYLVLLDDDSYPIGDAVTRSMDYMDLYRDVAAVVGRVVLPDGSLEACAMPAVMLSGAVCFRRSVAVSHGQFRPEFFRKAGEYDVSFRLWQAGYRVERFEDIVYRHDKVLSGRSRAFAHRMDLRNNLILCARYLPEPWRSVYWEDWSHRYRAIASADGCIWSVRQALMEARVWSVREKLKGRQILRDDVIETIFEHRRQAGLIGDWSARERIGRVLIADYAKTLHATWRGCRQAGLEVIGIADNGSAFGGLDYRGTTIASDLAWQRESIDGIVVANINPAQVERRVAALRSWYAGPILRLWEPRYLSSMLPLRAAA